MLQLYVMAFVKCDRRAGQASIFFRCDDVDAVAVRAKESGGMIHVAPTSMGGARLAALADPQGAAFSIIRPK